MKWIYVQAQFVKTDGDEQIWFRHTQVEADDQDGAYLKGQRLFPQMDNAAQMLNDYVIAVPSSAKSARWAKPKV